MEEIEKGSNDWVSGVIDWEGGTDSLEHIAPREITDPILRELWSEAQGIYYALEDAWAKIEDYLGEN